VAAFLGRADYRKLQEVMSSLMARLYLECLPRLVQELGGMVVLTGQFTDEGMLNAVEDTQAVDGHMHTFVIMGHVFICLPEERLVVSAAPAGSSLNPPMSVIVRSNKQAAAFFRTLGAYAKKNNYLRGRVYFADGELIERTRPRTLDDIVLPQPVRQCIERHVEGFLKNRDRLRRLGVKTRRGLILEGPPGTGKTLLGKVLADILPCSFMWVSPRHIDGAKSFAEALEVARFTAPTVVFLEDLDLFAEDRECHGGMALGELMNQLDGAVDNEDIVTVATTNRIEVVEKALRNRPGRFDRVLHLGEADGDCRRRLLARLLAKAAVTEPDMIRLVSVTDGYTGAQIEELTNTLYTELSPVWNGLNAEGGGECGKQVAEGRHLVGSQEAAEHPEAAAARPVGAGPIPRVEPGHHA
jgi:hypothetical protein